MSKQTAPIVTDTEKSRRLKRRLERLVWLLDDCLTIPGTKIKVGVDPVLGLIPGFGDVLSGLLSLYVVAVGWDANVPKPLLARMLRNIGVEVLVGFVPVLGDLFDLTWKANRRNLNLMDNYLDAALSPPAEPPPRKMRWLWALAALVFVLISVLILRSFSEFFIALF